MNRCKERGFELSAGKFQGILLSLQNYHKPKYLRWNYASQYKASYKFDMSNILLN